MSVEQAAKRTLPRADRAYQCAVGTSSGSSPYSSMTTISTAKVVLLEAAGGDVYVIGGTAGYTVATSSTALSGTTIPGIKIGNGTREEFWLTGDRLYHVGSAVCKLNVYEATDLG